MKNTKKTRQKIAPHWVRDQCGAMLFLWLVKRDYFFV